MMMTRKAMIALIALVMMMIDGMLAQCPGITASSMRTSVTQYGVTITFAAAAQVGQYSNGDYWVVGPVTISATTPAYDGTHNGFTVNPQSWSQQAYDVRVEGFNSSLVPALPLTVTGPASFVKAISVDYTATDCRPCLKTAIVLTVVAAQPAGDGLGLFRPAYFGRPTVNPRMSRAVASINRAMLPSVTNATVSSKLTLEVARGYHARLQLDHIQDWVGRYMHPSDNMPDYGSDIAIASNNAMLRLLFDDVTATTCAMITFIQAGLDYYSCLAAGMVWPANGGHCLGRKQIMVFAAIAL
jgi:hypothetical protein